MSWNRVVGRPRRRWLVAGLLVGLTGVGCGDQHSRSRFAWAQVPPSVLGAAPGVIPLPATVSAAQAGQPWLIGGVVMGHAKTPQVAVWEAPSLSGPWHADSLAAIPGRDGPNETMLYFARDAVTTVAFGSRASPTEGYPRPSAWAPTSRGDQGWREILEDREMFGGPNIIGYGGASAGPHGIFIAGTWTDTQGHPVASVWSSPDGTRWTRNATAPTFAGQPGEIPFGQGIADSSNGLLLIATSEIPTPSDPAGARGAMWYSSNGSSWSRVSAPLIAQEAPLSAFSAVAATSAGWIVAGTRTSSGATAPAVWFVDTKLSLGHPLLLSRPVAFGSVSLTSVSATASQVIVAGVESGRPVLWEASLSEGHPGPWRTVPAPPAAIPGLTRVVVSSSSGGTIAVLAGTTRAEVWVTAGG